MIFFGRSTVLFFLLLIVTSCTGGKSKVASLTVVQLNDRTLSAKDFADQLARSLKKFDAILAKDPGHVQGAKEEIIRNFLLQAMTSDFAENNGISVSDTELDDGVNQTRATYPDDISFRRALSDENISFNEWKDQLRQSLLDQKVFQLINAKTPKATSEELKKYFDENRERYRRKERVFLRQIVSDDLTRAQTIKDELKKVDFQTLAKKYSVSPEAKSGGLVGWVERGSVDIFDKAFLLPVGGVSQVLESTYGFHIFSVEKKAAAGIADFTEVESQVERLLMAKREQAEFMGWLDKQIRTSKVLRNNELIQSISVETRGVVQ